MAGLGGLYKMQLGKETVLGTEVNATSYIRVPRMLLADESAPVYPDEAVGIIGGVGRNYVPKKVAALPIPDIECTFEQLPYLLNMGVVGVAGVQDGAGSDYVYTYPFPYNAVQAPYSYTVEFGDNQQAEIMTACFAEEIVIKGAAEEAWMMSATLRGWPGATTTFTGSLSIPTVEEVIFGLSKLYINDVGSGFGATQVTSSFLSFELTITNVFRARWTGDGTNKYFTKIDLYSPYEVSLAFTLEHDATSVAERAKRRGSGTPEAGTPRAIKIIGEGSTVGTPGTTYSKKSVILNICGTYNEPEALEEDDGNMVIPFMLKNHYNSTLASRGNIIVVNELSALP